MHWAGFRVEDTAQYGENVTKYYGESEHIGR